MVGSDLRFWSEGNLSIKHFYSLEELWLLLPGSSPMMLFSRPFKRLLQPFHLPQTERLNILSVPHMCTQDTRWLVSPQRGLEFQAETSGRRGSGSEGNHWLCNIVSLTLLHASSSLICLPSACSQRWSFHSPGSCWHRLVWPQEKERSASARKSETSLRQSIC